MQNLNRRSCRYITRLLFLVPGVFLTAANVMCALFIRLAVHKSANRDSSGTRWNNRNLLVILCKEFVRRKAGAFAFPLIRFCIFIALSPTFVAISLQAGDTAPYLNKAAPLEDRVTDLLGRLTADEKISLLSGANSSTTMAIPRLQIPGMRMADAGSGVRGIDDSNNGPASLFPDAVMMAATWDPALIGRAAAAIGEEAHNKKAGSQILLGPAVNIQRSPLGGRNAEYFSEDPFLAGQMAVGFINGIQAVGTAACIKHFACNNEEVDRREVDVKVGERALREIYLPAFEAGVKEGHVWTVMSSYNRVNGPHASANRYLLTDVLKQGWGFDGMVMSDWHGAHQTATVINAGNDLEMPGPGKYLNPAAVDLALQNGQTTTAVIDENVRRILRTIIRTGLLDGPWQINPDSVNSPEHQKLTREVAEQGIVLLKNQGSLLPLDMTKFHSIALIGIAVTNLQISGRGSADGTPFYSISPLAGITKRAGEKVAISFASGNPVNEAVDAAKKSDVAVVFVSSFRTEGEKHDRPSMSLPGRQDALVRAVAAANKRTIVVLNCGTPMDLRAWLDQVPGLLAVWYPGQEGGSAIAAVLFGDVNPSGKLPTTFGARRENYPDYGNFPGVKNRVNYEEGIYVGYRHFDKENIAPLFPFGFGLSYTAFEYGSLQLSQSTLDPHGKVSVSLEVKNTGSRAGQEVVELYAHDPSPQIDKPIRELKGFVKVSLEPGERKTVSLPVKARDFAYFDVPGKQWKADAGDYEIQVGASSRDIRQQATVRLVSTFTEAVPLSSDQLALNGGFEKNAAKDLAAGRPTQASSALEAFGAENAVDNDDTNHWSSQRGSPQWLKVDLGKTASINRVRLFWGDDYALDYALQVSGDGQSWTDVARTSKGMGDIEWIRFAPTEARWVRVLANRPGKTGGGYSLNSFEVYGSSEHPLPDSP